MTKGQKELVEYWLKRADETFDEAKVMMDTDHPHGCANRLYYACFYAVTALLLSKNLSSSKHSGVISLFNKNFVKPGIIPVELGKFYSRLFEGRMESDYGDWVELETEINAEDFDLAQSFINKIVEIIRV
jgi:hypothetical protein